MSGRNSYIGANEVAQLIGKWQSIVGSEPQFDITGADVAFHPYGPYHARPIVAPSHHHHHPHGRWAGYQQPYQPPYQPPYRAPLPRPVAPFSPAIPSYVPMATTVRDHRRAALEHAAFVRGDHAAIGALTLMGAEDAAAAAQGTVPADATIPAPPLPAAPPAALAPVDPGPPPQGGHGHRGHRGHGGHGHHGGGGGGYPQYAPQYASQWYQPDYMIPPRNQLVDRPGPTRADRITLPMSSGVNILPNTSAQITSRPQNVAFRPERIIIGGAPGDWVVNDIKVGNRSQFSQSGDVPGEMFAATTIDSFVSMETVQTAMDFVMLVTYVGASESGAPFVCGVLGTAAV